MYKILITISLLFTIAYGRNLDATVLLINDISSKAMDQTKAPHEQLAGYYMVDFNGEIFDDITLKYVNRNDLALMFYFYTTKKYSDEFLEELTKEIFCSTKMVDFKKENPGQKLFLYYHIEGTTIKIYSPEISICK
jgi:hypothetical protein